MGFNRREKSMNYWICATCGTQFSLSERAPEHCPICEDQRQYVGHQGQEWTSIGLLQEKGYKNVVKQEEQDLIGVGISPRFAIGQRALLLRHEKGNVLWDCISLVDDETVAAIQELGGLSAIAISHPHFYSSMIEWAEHFDAQVFLHAKDRQWVMRESPRIHFWEGRTLSLWDGLTLINCGGHFEGGTVLHWPAGASGKGALLTGDIITVVQDRRHVSFMRSYPNLIPLGSAEIKRILETIEPFSFDQIYGGWWSANVLTDAKTAVARPAQRYLRAIACAGGSA